LERWAPWTAAALILAGVARLAAGFPWRGAVQGALAANLGLVALALVVNLVSLGLKGWAWQLILRPIRRIPWRSAQAATLAGAAVADLATSLVGEAARLHLLTVKTGLSFRYGLASVVYVRAVEGLALALVLASASLLVSAPGLRFIEGASAVTLLLGTLVLVRRPRLPGLGYLPRPLRRAVMALGKMAQARTLPAPLALALVNWAAQWATYALVLAACGVRPAWEASFAALVAANLAGLVPVSPGNVGVFQAAVIMGLLPLGIGADRAALAGLLLQAIQIPPVLGLAAMVFGWRGLRQLRSAVLLRRRAVPAEDGATA
jgi:uncharacterized membrane protein YbhN (UPF0104 family)